MPKKAKTQPIAPPLERKELSDNPVKLCNEISRIFRMRMREQVEQEGVMSQQGARLCLSLLAISDGVSQRELVARTHLRPPTVSLILKRMVEEGLVTMRGDEKDMRITRAYLTDKGRQIDRESISRIKTVDARGLYGISAEEQETLMTLLCKIRENLLKDEENQ